MVVRGQPPSNLPYEPECGPAPMSTSSQQCSQENTELPEEHPKTSVKTNNIWKYTNKTNKYKSNI